MSPTFVSPWRCSIVALSGLLVGLAGAEAEACGVKGPKAIMRGAEHGQVVPMGPITPTIFSDEIPEPTLAIPRRSPGVWWWRPIQCARPDATVARYVDGRWQAQSVEPVLSDIRDDEGAGWWVRPEGGWMVGSVYHVEVSCGRCSRDHCEVGRSSIATELRVVEDVEPHDEPAASSSSVEEPRDAPLWPVFVLGLVNLGVFVTGCRRGHSRVR